MQWALSTAICLSRRSQLLDKVNANSVICSDTRVPARFAALKWDTSRKTPSMILYFQPLFPVWFETVLWIFYSANKNFLAYLVHSVYAFIYCHLVDISHSFNSGYPHTWIHIIFCFKISFIMGFFLTPLRVANYIVPSWNTRTVLKQKVFSCCCTTFHHPEDMNCFMFLDFVNPLGLRQKVKGRWQG